MSTRRGFLKGIATRGAKPRRGGLLYKRMPVLFVGSLVASVCLAAPVKVACVGDSITAGTKLKDPRHEAYPAQLQAVLGGGYAVRNFGVGGLCVYRHLSWGKSPRAWEYSVACTNALVWKPDIVVAGLGANDWEEYHKEFAFDEDGNMMLPRGTFRGQYVALLKRFREANPNVRIVMWTKLSPLSHGHRCYGSPIPVVMRADLEAVAAEVGAKPFDAFAPMLPYVKTGFAPDGIHPGPEAAGALARAVAEAVRMSAAQPGEGQSQTIW